MGDMDFRAVVENEARRDAVAYSREHPGAAGPYHVDWVNEAWCDLTEDLSLDAELALVLWPAYLVAFLEKTETLTGVVAPPEQIGGAARTNPHPRFQRKQA
jgi:hypothetical protein